MTYRLHYAPDNASMIIRLALEELGAPYATQLVDRARQGQRDPAYLRLNPNGLIPVLETPEGNLFETGAILLWLADRHGRLFPAPESPKRGDALKWLFFLSNTLHPALRMMFYPQCYAGDVPEDRARLRAFTREALLKHFQTLEDNWRFDADQPIISDLYLAAQLRWVQLYPLAEDRSWFRLAQFTRLHAMAEALETRPSTHAVQAAEGLGPTPFTAPHAPCPPEGSAT